MLPLVLNPKSVTVGFAGYGVQAEQRRQWLRDGGIEPLEVRVGAEALPAGLDVLYVAGLTRKQAERLAGLARRSRVLVNVEDHPDFCDFHVPAVVRRGDLLLTVSSAGRSPGLVKLLRQWLAQRLGAEWADRLDELSRHREHWRREGVPAGEISERTQTIAGAWLP